MVISSDETGASGFYVDDGIEITVTKPDGTQDSFLSGYRSYPVDVTSLFGVGNNHVNITLLDTGEVLIGNGVLYLVNTNTTDPVPPNPNSTLHEISLAPIANTNYTQIYTNPPLGEVVLAGIPFSIPPQGNNAYGTDSVNNSLILNTNIANPFKLHMLLISGNTWAQTAGKEAGYIKMYFDDGSSYKTKLIIGQNIREWSQHYNTVNTVTDPGSHEIFSEIADYRHILDLLTLHVPSDYQHKTLTGVSITDTYNTDVNVVILWSGLTVESQTLPPESCSVTTSPSTKTLSIGGTTAISASVTSGLGSATVTSMKFGSYNTTLATVSPSDEGDTTSPYPTTITAVAQGDTAVWATADLSDGRTCPSSAETDTDITVTPAPKTPVILIPGIMGSEFEVKEDIPNSGITQCTNIFADYEYKQGDTVWWNTSTNIIFDNVVCARYLDILTLQPDGKTDVHPEVGLKDSIVGIDFAGNHAGYTDTIPFLISKGYELKKDLFVFPFDWRKDLSQNITALNNKIDTAMTSAGTTQVQIVAHSMGGLIARDYIRDPEHAKKVDTIVELGTPHAGSPNALAHIMYNKCVKALGLICIINGNEVNKLLQNFPGSFDLLPSKVYYQLYPDHKDFPFNDGRDIDNNGVKGALDYTQTKALLSNVGKNMPVFEMAEHYHDAVDPTFNINDALSTVTNGVKCI